LIDRCSRWDKQSPIFEKNEITMLDDLTHNDVVIRQINASTILKQLVEKRMQSTNVTDFRFPDDFYGDAKYWLKASLFMKLTMIAFIVIYVPQLFILKGLVCLLTPFDKCNIVIQLKKKLRSLTRARLYLTELNKPVELTDKVSLIDHHLHQQAMYSKFHSLVT
jgi:hypothetical protein